MNNIFTKTHIVNLLVLNAFLFCSNAVVAQFNNNNYYDYYPQVFFNINDASNKLDKGNSTIKGVASTNSRNTKHLAYNNLVILLPVTDYFIEWKKLAEKVGGKPNTNVVMVKEAFQYRIETRTDEYGNFTFANLKPGKYYLECNIDYVGVEQGIEQTGTIYYGTIASNPIYEKRSYNYNGSKTESIYVEIETDGQLKQVKLKPSFFKKNEDIGGKPASSQNCYRKNNLQNGVCNEYYENGTLSAVVEWRDDLQHGETVYYYPNGKSKTAGNFNSGLITGIWKDFYENETLKSVMNYELKNDFSVLEGPAKYFHPNGALQAEGEYFNKVKKGLWKYYDENGKKSSEETFVYKNDQSYLEGIVTNYYPSGKIKETDTYLNEKVNGEIISYYESGAMKMKAIFKDDERHGPVIYFNEKGEITKKEEYVNGTLVE